MDVLRRAIDDLYSAFADAAAPKHIDGCPCCIGNKRIPELLATPLREIPADVLSPYAASALLTVGDVSDYLYFLPRMINLTIQEWPWWPSLPVTIGAIRSTGFETWPSSRQKALTQVLNAAFDNYLENGPYVELGGWLCGVALLGLDVRPYLARMELVPEAVLSYFEDNERCLKKGRLCDSFWELPNAGHEEILRWFRSERIRQIPYEAYGYVMPTSSEQPHPPEPAISRMPRDFGRHAGQKNDR